MARSGAITLGQKEPRSDGNEGVLGIPQSSSNIGTSPSDFLMSYPEHLFGEGSYPSAEMQSVYSTASADLAISFLADLDKVVVFMVFTRFLNFKSSSPFINPLVTVWSAPITISITVTSMFHSFFFNSFARSRYLSFFSLSLNFTLWSAGTTKSTIRHYLFFFFLVDDH